MKDTSSWGAIDAIRATACTPLDRPASSFSVRQYSARYQIPFPTAQRQLTVMAEKGLLLTKKCLVDGRISNVYWVPSEEEKPCGGSSSKRTRKSSTR